MTSIPSSSKHGEIREEEVTEMVSSSKGEEPATSSDTPPVERQTTLEETTNARSRCGVWALGVAFADQEKLRTDLDRLGPFILDSCACPLPLIDSTQTGFFDSDSDDDEKSNTDLRELQELQLNDVVHSDTANPVEDLLDSDDQESIEEVSDRLFEQREVVEEIGIDQHPAKRKRKEHTNRNNFVKHNLRRRTKALPRKRTKLTNKPKQPQPQPIRSEGVC